MDHQVARVQLTLEVIQAKMEVVPFPQHLAVPKRMAQIQLLILKVRVPVLLQPLEINQYLVANQIVRVALMQTASMEVLELTLMVKLKLLAILLILLL